MSRITVKSAPAQQGKDLFFGEEKCNFCHRNAGASAEIASSKDPGEPVITGNANFNTGVEDIPDHPARVVGFLPRDGGFGQTANVDGKGGFGDGTFNTPPLVEAADTGPFFHNNARSTIEEAVAFFGTDAFNESDANCSRLSSRKDG